MTDIYEEIVKIKAAGEEAALVTVVSATGSTPREEGAKMLVRADGGMVGTIGGGMAEKLAAEEALAAIKQGVPRRLHYSLKGDSEPGMICGGDMEVFIEPILNDPMMYIFGGGYIALSLVKVAKLVGFEVVVIDDRAEFADPKRFPEAELTINENFTGVFPKLKINKASYIVIVTHGHKGDEVVLERALTTTAKYIGMIGSRTKINTVFSHLLAKGISQEQLEKVHAPIGLDIAAQTPAEIAVSIMAEIIKVRRTPLQAKG